MSTGEIALDQLDRLESLEGEGPDVEELLFIEAPSDVFSLDDLLSESMVAAAERDRMKLLRKKVAEGKAPAAERNADIELLRQWELKREWNKSANVICFERCKCIGCGQFHSIFMGYFERQIHKTNTKLERLVKVEKFASDLTKEVRYSDHNVPTCEDCAEFAGFPVEE
jgi:hypothetical protein